MNYYIGEGTEQRGPFSIEQLRDMRLTPSTLVWREGMAQWQPAGSIPELAAFFAGGPQSVSPPPAPPSVAVGYHGAPAYNAAESKRVMAGVFGILLGPLGIHKFVLGYTGAGLLVLLTTIFTCGMVSFVWHVIGIIEGIIYLSKSDAEFIQTYQVGRKTWF